MHFKKGEITQASCMIIYKREIRVNSSASYCFKPKCFSILQLICPAVIEEECEVCWWSFLYTIRDHKAIVRERESWLVSEPGDLSLRNFLENTSEREQAQEAEAVLLETVWVSNLSPCFWSPHWCCEKAVINTSGRKQQESGTWNAIIVPLHVQFKTKCSS